MGGWLDDWMGGWMNTQVVWVGGWMSRWDGDYCTTAVRCCQEWPQCRPAGAYGTKRPPGKCRMARGTNALPRCPALA